MSDLTQPLSFRRLFAEWVFIALSLLMFVGWANTTKVSELLNNYAYDYILRAQSYVADEQIVIVAIDDASLQEVGRWPWSRRTHAQFLDQLQAQQPKAVLLDVLFMEPSTDDVLFQQSLHKLSQNTVVAAPVLLSSYAGESAQVTLPIDAIQATSRLGQIVNLPDADGVVRQSRLLLTDAHQRNWPVLSSTLLDLGVQEQLKMQYNSSFRIPFRPKGAYQTLPYSSVLRGEVAADFLRDKYVLVGATAAGLGDQITTPASGASGTVSGIEVHANVLDTLLHNNPIVQVSDNTILVLSIATPILLLMFLFLYCDERFHLLAVLLAYLLCIVYAFWQRIWLPPVNTCVALILAYFIWSWRRSTVMLRYVKIELRNAELQTGRLPTFLAQKPDTGFLSSYTLESQMQKIHQLYQFSVNGLAHLPTALIAVGADGEILLTNNKAQLSFEITEVNLIDVLRRLDAHLTLRSIDSAGLWITALQNTELTAQDNRIYQLHVTSLVCLADASNTSSARSIWLVNFLDLSNERLAEHQRSELVSFLSHDLRTPQVSILSLIELQKNSATQLSEADFYHRLSEKVHLTLNWSHDLVQLSRANDHNYQKNEINFAHLIDEVLAQMLDLANAKKIDLCFLDEHRQIAENIWLQADGALLMRAFINLISNALRYSPSLSEVRIELMDDFDVHDSLPNGQRNYFVCRIVDQGCGMSSAQVEQLHNGRSSAATLDVHNTPDAAQRLGIGFLMAKTVVSRHAGYVRVESEVNKGTTVHVFLPHD